MRIKVREFLSKTARWMELLTAGCVILAIAVLTLIMLKEYIFHWESLLKEDALEIFLQRILSFVIGIEFVKMLIQHSPMGLIDWADQLETPAGIGVDLVNIAELQALDVRTKGAFARHSFTQREREEAEKAIDKWSYFAGRFAVKEAVFKALARLIPEKSFDFRIVETLRQLDGSPAITHDGSMLEVLHMANVDKLLVSISNEGGFSIAFVTARLLK